MICPFMSKPIVYSQTDSKGDNYKELFEADSLKIVVLAGVVVQSGAD